MKIALIAPNREVNAWATIIENTTGFPAQVWPQINFPGKVEVAIAWKPPREAFLPLKNLKLISSLGAGVDSILDQPGLPDVPIMRIVDPKMTEDLTNYMVMQVLNLHHGNFEHIRNQKKHYWQPKREPRPAWDIGILGFGIMGQATAKKLDTLGFRVHVWRLHEFKDPNFPTYYGKQQMEKLIQKIDVLINLLPLTDETRSILNLQLFEKSDKAICLINAARGEHMVEADLLHALDVGFISFACLDVFREEPLPANHRFWDHPKIAITPHIAGITNPLTAVKQILNNYSRLKTGQPLLNIVDPARGY